MSYQSRAVNSSTGKANIVMITVTPAPGPLGRRGYFDANLGDGRVLVRASRQPFVDAARRLVDLGYDPATVLVMRHPESDTDCLTAQIGVAAKLRVKEDRNGPRFVLWEPFPRRVGAWAREKAEGIGGSAPDQSDEPSAPSGASREGRPAIDINACPHGLTQWRRTTSTCEHARCAAP